MKFLKGARFEDVPIDTKIATISFGKFIKKKWYALRSRTGEHLFTNLRVSVGYYEGFERGGGRFAKNTDKLFDCIETRLHFDKKGTKRHPKYNYGELYVLSFGPISLETNHAICNIFIVEESGITDYENDDDRGFWGWMMRNSPRYWVRDPSLSIKFLGLDNDDKILHIEEG